MFNKICILIPSLNPDEKLMRTIDGLKEIGFKIFVIVDDGSDAAHQKNFPVTDKENNFIVLRHPYNKGKGAAIKTAFKFILKYSTTIEGVITVDGDGQHDPRYLAKVCQPVIDGEYDMAIGSRFIEKEGFQSSFMRRLGINIISLLIKILSGKKVYDVTSGYRACNRQLIEFFADNYADDYPEPEAILSCVLNGYKVGEVPVVMEERQGGVSSIRSLKSAYYMIKVCLALVVDRISTKRKAGK